MFRFTLIPLLLLFGGIFFSFFAYMVYRKIKRGVQYTYDKGTEISSQYKEKWRTQEQRKKFPKIVQTGFDDFQIIESNIKHLPEEWQSLLLPLQQQSQQLLNEISQQLLTDESFERSRLSSLRSFFIHSLDALKQFTEKLLSDHQTLSLVEKQLAKENISHIEADLSHHEKILHKKRKFDFEVLMGVIKARLKS